jgi:hypothetical protein
MIKRYSDLRRLATAEERFEYLKLGGAVGRETFGFDRYLNQGFYRSAEWKYIRRDVIARDRGCDLGIEDYPIHDRVYVHHMNPMVVSDLTEFNEDILNPEFLISVTLDTHNAIHYGSGDPYERRRPVERRPGDTRLW